MTKARTLADFNTTSIPASVITGLPAGAMTLVSSGNVTAGDASKTLTGIFTNTCSIYKIFLYDWNGSVGNAPYLRWLTGTNTEQSGSGDYAYAGVGFDSNGGASNWSGSDTQLQIASESLRPDGGDCFAWEGTLYNPSNSTLKKRLVFSCSGRDTNNYSFNSHGTGEWAGTSPLTGLKVFPSGGTFDSLSWRIYGIEG